jgi:hypothetical protein
MSMQRSATFACTLVFVIGALAGVASCSGGSGNGASDPVAPVASITFPPPISATGNDRITVHGTVAPANGVSEVRVNSVAATTTDGFANWQANVPLSAASNTLAVTTVSIDGSVTTTPALATVTRSSAIGLPVGVAVDSARDRVLIVDQRRKVLVGLDLATGIRADLVALPSVEFVGRVVMDAGNDRAFIMTRGFVLSVNLLDNSRGPNILVPLPLDMAIDAATNHGYLLLGNDPVEFPFPPRVMRIDLATWQLTELAGPTLPNPQNPFPGGSAIALDSTNNRLLVGGPRTVNTVDLASGAGGVLSGPGVPDNNNLLDYASSIAVDQARNRALVVDSSRSAVIAVDLGTGARTTLSDAGTPDAMNPLQAPVTSAIDPSRNRLLVADATQQAIVAVDLASGVRTFVTHNGVPNPGNRFFFTTALVVDSARNRLLIADDTWNQILAVDLDTAVRTVFSGPTIPALPAGYDSPAGMAIDTERDRLLVGDYLTGRLLAIDLRNGDGSVLTQSGSSVLQAPVAMAVDVPRRRALTLDFQTRSMVAVDLATGNAAVISGAGIPNDDNLLQSPRSIALDAARNRALVADQAQRVVAIDLGNGARTVLSSSANTASFAQHIALDASGTRAALVDGGLGALVAIDLVTGARTVISDRSTDPGLVWDYPYALAQHPTRGYWFVADLSGSVYAVHPQTGARVVFSR